MEGRIKLHRKLLDNVISKDAELLGLLTFFLLKANHTDHDYIINKKKVNIKRGQFIFSIRGIAEHFRRSVGKSQRIVKLLEDEKISIHKGTSKYSLFTIINWDNYQLADTQTDTQTDTHTIHRQVSYKNDKNDENEKEKKYTHILKKKKEITMGIDNTQFDIFRKEYPNKKGKDTCKKLLKDMNIAEYQKVISGAMQYSAESIGKEKKYIKHADTWIRNKCWEDYTDITRDELKQEMISTRTTNEGDPNWYGQGMKSKYKLLGDDWESKWMEDKDEIKHTKSLANKK